MGRSSSGSDDALSPFERTVLSDPLIGAHLGEYVIRERIGEGGMGIVYRGEQPLIGKQVAVKVLRPEVGARSHHVERLLAEARAVNAIRHRGIIDIFSFGETADGRQYFVMEYLEGSALDAHLDQHDGILPLREVYRLSEEILDALGAAHVAGVIHRDLKPNNIFLVRQPVGGGTYVKVLDFGLAKQSSSSYGATPQTQQGLVMGTPEYMAPEQACAKPVSPSTDLYAFGVMLFQMLTGQLPFKASSSMELLIQHVTQPPPSVLDLRPELPPALAELVLRLMAKEPEERPSMAEVRAGLQRLAHSLPDGNTPARPTRASKAHAAPRRADAPRNPPKEAPPAKTLPEEMPLPAPRRADAPRNLPKEAPPAETVSEEMAVPAPRRSRSALVIAAGGGLLLAAGLGVLLFPRPEPQPVAAPSVEAQAPVPAKPPPTAPPAEPHAEPTPAPASEAVAPATGSAPVAAEQVQPPPAPVETPPELEPPSSRTPDTRPSRNPLLVRIARLEKKLRSVWLPVDEREQARKLLDKARGMARDAETSDSRKQVSDNLDIWEQMYLER